MKEKLILLTDINEKIYHDQEHQKDYWETIRQGLSNNSQYCRNMAIQLLKLNIKKYQQTNELLWTTFFDIYDTFESFGSHLTKAVWPRTEIFYNYLKDSAEPKHALEDFSFWLEALYQRASCHINLKVRRYIQKQTLERTYMTDKVSNILFKELIMALDQGLIFKDSSLFTQFSKNLESVYCFYSNHFKLHPQDLPKIFAVLKKITHP